MRSLFWYGCCGFVLPRIFTDLGGFTQYCADLCDYCGAAAVRGHHLGGDAVIRQVRRGYALGYKLWFYDFFVNMRKWVWKCAK